MNGNRDKSILVHIIRFLNAHKQIPWRQIKGFRNIVAHAYGTIEPAVVWDIISNDLSSLKDYCQICLAEFQRQE